MESIKQLIASALRVLIVSVIIIAILIPTNMLEKTMMKSKDTLIMTTSILAGMDYIFTRMLMGKKKKRRRR